MFSELDEDSDIVMKPSGCKTRWKIMFRDHDARAIYQFLRKEGIESENSYGGYRRGYCTIYIRAKKDADLLMEMYPIIKLWR